MLPWPPPAAGLSALADQPSVFYDLLGSAAATELVFGSEAWEAGGRQRGLRARGIAARLCGAATPRRGPLSRDPRRTPQPLAAVKPYFRSLHVSSEMGPRVGEGEGGTAAAGGPPPRPMVKLSFALPYKGELGGGGDKPALLMQAPLLRQGACCLNAPGARSPLLTFPGHYVCTPSSPGRQPHAVDPELPERLLGLALALADLLAAYRLSPEQAKRAADARAKRAAATAKREEEERRKRQETRALQKKEEEKVGWGVRLLCPRRVPATRMDSRIPGPPPRSGCGG